MLRRALKLAFTRNAKGDHVPPIAPRGGRGEGGGRSRIALVLVNGPPDSVQGPRARALFGGEVPIVYKERGRFGSLQAIAAALRGVSAGWVYCIDLGFPGSLLAAVRSRLPSGVRLAYEIGEPARPLLANQARPSWELAIAHGIDRCLPGRADRLVFRGSYLSEYFKKIAPRRRLPRWIWLPDGADCDQFRPRRDESDVAALRRVHGLGGRFVVGLVGSLHHNRHVDLFYGWELAEALARLPADLPITGVVVGDGSGRPVLEAARDRLGLGDRLRLIGRVPHDVVPTWMNVFDVGLSTQTDDPVGWGRTTAKLPEYLACGTPVACSDVGEAHRWLASSGQTLPYNGLRDRAYPARLAQHLQAMRQQDLGPLRSQNRALALRLFDYRVLRTQIREFLAS
jgi:glycosyltransferase involved in cell wall biosynthesis